VADRPALKNPRVHIIMADGAEWDVQTLNADIIRYEDTALKHKWPTMTQSPQRWTTFLGYRASIREGLIPQDLRWEEFFENGPRVAVSVFVSDDVPVDPTPPEPGID
jgi:hypothetical protein